MTREIPAPQALKARKAHRAFRATLVSKVPRDLKAPKANPAHRANRDLKGKKATPANLDKMENLDWGCRSPRLPMPAESRWLMQRARAMCSERFLLAAVTQASLVQMARMAAIIPPA